MIICMIVQTDGIGEPLGGESYEMVSARVVLL